MLLLLLAALVPAVLLLLSVIPSRSGGDRHPRGGSLLKVILGYLLVRLGSWRKAQTKATADASVDRRIPPPSPEPCYNDSFVFQASDADGMFFINRLGFRGDGSVEVWFVFYFSDHGSVRMLKVEQELFPDTGDVFVISAGGITLSCLESGERWRVQFDGELVDELGRKHPATADLVWEATTGRFHSGLHMSMWSLAKSMAAMPWSRAYFGKLSSENQTRIEQGGTVRGRLTVDGKTRAIDGLGTRDHSWGKRDWTFLIRHVLIWGNLETPLVIDGQEFTSFSCSMSRYGSLFRQTPGLWIAGPNGVVRPIVENTDMAALVELTPGEEGAVAEGILPKDFEMEFVVGPTPAAVPGPHVKTTTLVTLRLTRTWQEGVGWYMKNPNMPNAYCLNETHGAFVLTVKETGETATGHGMIEMGFRNHHGFAFDFPE